MLVFKCEKYIGLIHIPFNYLFNALFHYYPVSEIKIFIPSAGKSDYK